MQLNKWTIALATVGAVSFVAQADEHPINTALSSTTLSGYVDTSAIWNLGTGGGSNARFVNTGANRQDGFNLNVVKVQLEKPLDEGTWSAGYKTELMFGPDASALPGLVAPNVALKQAYVALRAPVGNGLDFKIGEFDPIVGYEVTDSYANPNFARSYGFNNLEPFGHTGVLATYQFNEMFGASVGIANGDNGFGLNGGTLTARGSAFRETDKTYMASIVLKAPESTGWFAGSSLYAGVVHGTGSGSDPTLLYIGGTMATPWKQLTLGASADILLDARGGGFGGSYANAFAVYASYQFTEKLKMNNRFEYANSGYGAFATTVARDKVIGLTTTLDYSLWANVVTRAEFRWDRSVSSGGFIANNGKHNDFSILANVIYKF